jgi:hypothetical protein
VPLEARNNSSRKRSLKPNLSHAWAKRRGNTRAQPWPASCPRYSDAISVYLCGCYNYLPLKVFPTSKCKLRALKLERIKDFLLMEEEFITNQARAV